MSLSLQTSGLTVGSSPTVGTGVPVDSRRIVPTVGEDLAVTVFFRKTDGQSHSWVMTVIICKICFLVIKDFTDNRL